MAIRSKYATIAHYEFYQILQTSLEVLLCIMIEAKSTVVILDIWRAEAIQNTISESFISIFQIIIEIGKNS